MYIKAFKKDLTCKEFNMNNIKIVDFNDWGYQEVKQAFKLLEAYINNKTATHFFDWSSFKICFNTNSGYVFLADNDFNSAMLDNDLIRDWLTCLDCGCEGFYYEILEESQDTCCYEYILNYCVNNNLIDDDFICENLHTALKTNRDLQSYLKDFENQKTNDINIDEDIINNLVNFIKGV